MDTLLDLFSLVGVYIHAIEDFITWLYTVSFADAMTIASGLVMTMHPALGAFMLTVVNLPFVSPYADYPVIYFMFGGGIILYAAFAFIRFIIGIFK